MKKTTLLTVALISFLSISAAERTEKEMKKIAKKQLQELPIITRTNTALEVRKLADATNFNIYGTDKSFVIVSKDTRNTPVLAYSETAYNPERIPCGMQWWMNAMEEALEESNEEFLTRASEYAEVEPLLKTNWGQGDPYNFQCPSLNGVKTPSGCVATAMSQILNFFQYPKIGKGINSYTVKGGMRPRSVTFNKEYQYNLLKDNYDTETTAALTNEERDAISTLLLHCGAAVNMNYNADGSGANAFDATDGLATNLRFDSLSLHCYEREHFTNAEWMKMLTDELVARHPILYCGQDTRAGGHAFVVDGINANGLVHVNWGWDGDCNGYYSLDGMTPKRTVGFEFGYNFSSGQSMITGYKLQEKADEEDIYHSFWATSNAYSLKTASNGYSFTNIGGFYNYNWLPFKGTLAMVFEEDKEQGKQYSICWDEENFSNYEGLRMWGYGAQETAVISFTLINNRNIPAGKYRVFMGSKDNKETRYQPFRCGGQTGAIFFYVTKNNDGTFYTDAIQRQYPSISTGIESIHYHPQTSSSIYDLQGRRLSTSFDALPKGIYIKNGKKVTK